MTEASSPAAAALDHRLEHSVVVAAPKDAVFRFFTDSERWARWWGEGSRIEARPGGAMLIRYPNGATVSGEVLEVEPDERIVFTYGYDADGAPIPPGGSRVTLRLVEEPAGTRVELAHEVATAELRDAHRAGWAYHMALFANAVADVQHDDVDGTVDRFFQLWSEPDAEQRARALEVVATRDVRFRDRFGCVAGRRALADHLAALQVHMPGARLEREGGARHCQGTVVADWVSRGADGSETGRGTNVFRLAPDGRVRDVVGLWR